MTTKLVNGQRIEMSPEEEAAFEASRTPSEEQVKAAQIRQIETDFETEVKAIKTGYVHDEILSWDRQVQEAKAFDADPLASTPLLDAMVSTRGGTKQELATRILTNEAAYTLAFGEALGRKQKRIIDLG